MTKSIKKLSVKAVIFCYLFSIITYASDSSDIVPDEDCTSITAEQLESLEKHYCNLDLELEEEVETDKEVDLWMQDPKDVVPAKEKEPNSDEEAGEGEKTPEETEKEEEDGRFFGGGIGGFSISSEGLLGPNIVSDPILEDEELLNDSHIYNKSITTIENSITALNEYMDSLEDGSYEYLTIHEGINDGQWNTADYISNTALFVVGGIVIYKLSRLFNIAGYALMVAPAGAYADFDSEFKEWPQRIMKVSDKEKLKFLLADQEIQKNTLAILKFAQVNICNGIDQDLIKEKGIKYCNTVDLIFNAL